MVSCETRAAREMPEIRRSRWRARLLEIPPTAAEYGQDVDAASLILANDSLTRREGPGGEAGERDITKRANRSMKRHHRDI